MEEQKSEIQPSTQVEENKYAGFGIRFLAYLIDALLVSLVASSISYSVTKSFSNGAINIIVSILYFVLFWTQRNGQTLGKQLLALRVVRVDGKPMEWGTAVLRYVGYLISGALLGIGFLSIAWDKNKQGWHDKIASTYVVKTGEKPKTALAILIAIVFFLGMIGIISFIIFAASTLPYSKDIPPSFQKLMPTLSATDLTSLDQTVFKGINDYRTSKGMAPVVTDNKLCAYATRRLDVFNQRSGYDNGKGFYEDMNNPQIADAYFEPKANVSENFYPVNSIKNGSNIVTALTNAGNAGKNDIVSNPKVSMVCVLSDKAFMLIVSSTP